MQKADFLITRLITCPCNVNPLKDRTGVPLLYSKTGVYRGIHVILFYFFFYFFLIQFNVPFKIISLIETNQSVGGAKREYPGKTT